MGSFNVACGISNISISDEDSIGFVIIAPPLWNLSRKTSSGRNMYVNVDDIYKPFLPPVFGKYDSYGRIVDVEDSATKTYLETVFMRPAEKVLECIGNHGREIYSTYGPIGENYLIEGHELSKYGATDSEKLTSIGFTIEKGGNPEKPSYVFNGYVLKKLDETDWVVLGLNGETLTERIASHNGLDEVLTKFSEATKQYPGFEPEHWKFLRTLFQMSGMFFLKEVFLEMSEVSAKSFENNYYGEDTLEEDFNEFLATFDPTFKQTKGYVYDDYVVEGAKYRKYASSWGLKANNFLSGNTALHASYCDHLHLYIGHAAELKTLRTIREIASITNRMLVPSRYVGEGEDAAPLLALTDLTAKILAKRKKEYDDYNEGWE